MTKSTKASASNRTSIVGCNMSQFGQILLVIALDTISEACMTKQIENCCLVILKASRVTNTEMSAKIEGTVIGWIHVRDSVL
jgi:hypothetical protein